MSEALFARLRMAYMRGAAWRDENGSLDLVEKASYDYADKETTPLAENYREPGEFGEGATVRRAEQATDRQIELMKDFWSYYGAPPHKREMDTRLLKKDFLSLIARLDAAEAALRKIAAYDDAAANAYLRATGSYRCFDEPGAVEMARGVLEGKTDG